MFKIRTLLKDLVGNYKEEKVKKQEIIEMQEAREKIRQEIGGHDPTINTPKLSTVDNEDEPPFIPNPLMENSYIINPKYKGK